MKTVHGDLIKLALAGDFDIIVHGCNCDRVMGAGIAAQIRKTFPDAWDADATSNQIWARPEDKLGKFTQARVLRWDNPNNHRYLRIINAYTQRHPRPPVDYDAVRSCFQGVARIAWEYAKNEETCRIGYPMIGAGLAGGNWSMISGIIDKALQGLDHTLVVYQP